MFKKYKKLFILFAYLLLITALVTQSVHNSFMLTLMGLFFLIFSFFKVIHLKKFVASFARYDLLARVMKPYGYVYPFIEIILGSLFLYGAFTEVAAILTVAVLGITTIGIIQKLRQGEILECACLGVVFDLPLSKVTVFENTAMIVMALVHVL